MAGGENKSAFGSKKDGLNSPFNGKSRGSEAVEEPQNIPTSEAPMSGLELQYSSVGHKSIRR